MPLQDLDALPRDRWGRPKLILPGTDARVAFTRASTLSGAIENTFGLEQWKQRNIAQGLARRTDLIKRARVDTDVKGLNSVVAEAMNEMETDKGASLGTQIHSLTELADKGLPLPTDTDPQIVALLDEYRHVTEKLEIVATEQFVAAKQIMAAGTFDRIVRAPDGRLYILDIKTGIEAPKYAHSAQVQMAIYAHGTQYTYPGDHWARLSLADKGVDQDRAIMVHVPQNGAPCKLYWVDIRQGWTFAIVATKVRSWWSTNPTTAIDTFR